MQPHSQAFTTSSIGHFLYARYMRKCECDVLSDLPGQAGLFRVLNHYVHDVSILETKLLL